MDSIRKWVLKQPLVRRFKVWDDPIQPLVKQRSRLTVKETFKTSVKSERYLIRPRSMNSFNLIQALMSLAFLITLMLVCIEHKCVRFKASLLLRIQMQYTH